MTQKKSKNAKAKGTVNLKAKCVECGKEFTRSKYASNQKRCPKCAHAEKLNRIKAKNEWKRKVASLRNYAEYVRNNKAKVEKATKALSKVGTSKRFQWFKRNDESYLTWVKKNKVAK
jgi:NAD-dependent SIR2 family protein deacetylase